MLKPDLHCHSHFSDGHHSPQYLVQCALENGLSHLAVTDHDFITRHDDSIAANNQLQLISGVEISSAWNDREVHIVGLFIDVNNDGLNNLLYTQREKRKKRIHAMGQRLNDKGITGLVDYLESLKCETWTRSHVAEFLVNNGHCKSWDKAFKRFLSRRGHAYVPIEWASLETTVMNINKAGGIAIVAHPGRYGLTRTKTKRLVSDFKNAGGEAIEGSYGNIDPSTREFLCDLAEEEELHISVGSDFHSAERQWTNLGKFPSLGPGATKNAIWNHPRWHF